jgi:hypothetical protein
MDHIDYGQYRINATGEKKVLQRHYLNHTICYINGLIFTDLDQLPIKHTNITHSNTFAHASQGLIDA